MFFVMIDLAQDIIMPKNLNYSKRKYTIRTIRKFNSQSKDYDEIFKFYTAHTDEKQKSIAWLKEIVNKLQSKTQFIDAGAGNGILTRALAPYFVHTAALEPNPELRRQLQQNCPEINIQPDFIMDADISVKADFILCSHVLYYVEQTQWLAHIEKMAAWIAPYGALVLMLQHHKSDCMQIQNHFFQRTFNLASMAQKFNKKNEKKYQVDIEIMPVELIVPDIASACRIAEFMLNLLPVANMPARNEVESYIRRYFYPETQDYRFSSDQTLILIRKQRSHLQK